jgi:hypothetical protein
VTAPAPSPRQLEQLNNELSAARQRLKLAKKQHDEADLSGDMTDEILEEVVIAEEEVQAAEEILKRACGGRA